MGVALLTNTDHDLHACVGAYSHMVRQGSAYVRPGPGPGSGAERLWPLQRADAKAHKGPSFPAEHLPVRAHTHAPTPAQHGATPGEQGFEQVQVDRKAFHWREAKQASAGMRGVRVGGVQGRGACAQVGGDHSLFCVLRCPGMLSGCVVARCDTL